MSFETFYRTVGQEEQIRLDLALKTLREMFADRGYDTTANWPDSSTVNTMADYAALTTIVRKPDNSAPILLFYVGEKSVGKQTIQTLNNRMEQEKVKHAILVLCGKLTPAGSQELLELTRVRTETERKKTQRKRIEKFAEAELLFNITTHELVPQHRALNEDEKSEVLNLYGKSESFPTILISDPVARYYGWTRGQMIEIKRRSETAGSYTFYRKVV